MQARRSSHHRSLAIICAATAAVVMTLHAFNVFLLLKPDYVMQQWIAFTLPAKEDGRLVFMAIDAPALPHDLVYPEEIAASPALRLMDRPFPWSRELYGLIAERLIKAGAKAVAFDLILSGEGEGDAAFRDVLERYRGRIVIGFDFPEESSGKGNVERLRKPSPSLIPSGGADDPRIGFVTVWPDVDGVVHHVFFRRSLTDIMGVAPIAGAPVFESLGARCLRQAGFGNLIPADTDPHGIRYAYTGFLQRRSTLEPHPVHEIFTDLWKPNYADGESFRDKIVVVGPWGKWSKDYVPTPWGSVAGVLVHLNAMNALLTGEFLHPAPLWLDLLIIAAAGAASWLLGLLVARPGLRAIYLLLVILLWLALSILLFRAGWVVLVFSPMLTLFTSGGGFLGLEFYLERVERMRIRSTLERYVSKDVVKEVLDNPASYLNTVGGARRKISILFSDIRGFTSIVEEADASRLVPQLNEYFTEMVKIVFAHDGTMDKFIGDAVMAHWGGIISNGDSRDACHAVSTALEMLRALEVLNEDWRKRGMMELRIGLGINHGYAIVGHLGSEEKQEFSAIGDSVNTASRLEGATKELHVDLLVGESVAPLVRHRFRLRTVDLLQLKGKTAPVEVFTALGEIGETSDPEWLSAYEDGIRLYRKREFEPAICRFEAASELRPGDWLIAEYLRRCRACLAAPPPVGWDGVFVMKTK